MKFPIIKLSFILLIGLFLSTQANAQACGQYGVTLSVFANDEMPFETAIVELIPLEEDETRGKTFVRDKENPAKFEIQFFEGHLIKTKYKLLVSAEGFDSFEREITFPHCNQQELKAVLKPAPVSQKMDNSFPQKSLSSEKVGQIKLLGTVYDENGAVIIGEKIKVLKDKKNVAEIKSNEYGEYEFQLQPGKYTIEYGGNWFIPYIVKDFYFADTFEGEFRKDIILKPKDIEPCGYAGVCPPIIKEIVKIEERQKEFTKTIRTKN